jgi:cytochrome c-type biogenesis protein
MGPGAVVEGGSLLLALPIALAAGLLSFLSPCVLPLVPGYVGYVTGTTAAGEARRGRTLAGVGLFVAGFSVVFLCWFVLAATAGVFLLRYEQVILRVAGVLVIVMGLVFIGQVTVLQRTVRPAWRPATGLAGAPLLGAVFAVGWTPCIGPTLTAISTLAFYEGDIGRALLLGLLYCAGLGVPFLLVALGVGWVGSSLAWVRRRIRAVNIAGGVLLVLVGALMVSGLWGVVLSSLGSVIGAFVPAL